MGEESPAALVAEKPDEPEKLASPQHVYRPNDPFQSSVDRVVVLGNVHSSGKPWVKKAFMFFFVILPFSLLEIIAVGTLFTEPAGQKLEKFLVLNVMALIVCTPYLLIWRANRPKKSKA